MTPDQIGAEIKERRERIEDLKFEVAILCMDLWRAAHGLRLGDIIEAENGKRGNVISFAEKTALCQMPQGNTFEILLDEDFEVLKRVWLEEPC
jgi:hypothetical protein